MVRTLSLSRCVGLDFETFSPVDLRTRGLDNYARAATVLMAATPTHSSALPSLPGDVYDFVTNPDAMEEFRDFVLRHVFDEGGRFIAHNAGFERAILVQLKIFTPAEARRFVIDSAVLSRALGAASSLEGAAAQLHDSPKMTEGLALIKRFSIPNSEFGHEAPTAAAIHNGSSELQSAWALFKEYCWRDAHASAEILRTAEEYLRHETISDELDYERLTAEMNEIGWPVDMLAVERMQNTYTANSHAEYEDFKRVYGGDTPNFSSTPQLKAWTAKRGIRATSFDEDSVKKLREKLNAVIPTLAEDDPKLDEYIEVEHLLETKQQLGGSSLRKLATIKNLVGPDDRLRHQYVHVGAGQSFRTSGRGVQMQNLKRLPATPMDMDILDRSGRYLAGNEELGQNIRQVFKASDLDGVLIVGDFSSVESRGLAYLAGAEWKLDAFRNGQDIYKVLAKEFYGAESLEAVTKEQRNWGKYSELGCGYQAGPGALKDLIYKWGSELSDAQALELLTMWRDTNPEAVALWASIDDLLQEAMEIQIDAEVRRNLANGLTLGFEVCAAPDSLALQHPGVRTLVMTLYEPAKSGRPILQRVFQGVYRRGREICYYKPSERVGGPLWLSHYTHPKTKRPKFYSIYGGKLTGILTQSFCRELFFYSLQQLDQVITTPHAGTLQIIGQFHDEIVVEWTPTSEAQPQGGELARALDIVRGAMTRPPAWAEDFPLAAELAYAPRYLK